MNKKLLLSILIPAIGIPVAGTAGVVAASQVPALQETNSNIQKELEELKQQIEALQNEIAKLRNDMNSQIAEVKQDYNSKIEAAQSEIKELQEQIKELTIQLEEDKKSIAADYSQQITDLKSYIDNKTLELENEIKSNTSKISELTTKHNEELSELETNFNSQIDELEETLSNTKTSLESDYNTKINDLKESTNSKIAEINEEIDDLQSQIDELTSKHNQDKEELSDEITNQVNNLQSQIDSRKQEIESLKQKEADDISTLTTKHNADIASLNESFAAQKLELQNDYNAQIDNLESAFQEEIDNLQDIIDADKAALVVFKDQYITEKAALEASLQADLTALESDYNTKISNINSQITDLTNDIIDLENEMNQKIEDIQNDYNSKINDLVTRIESLEQVQYHTVTFNTNGGSNIASVQVKHGEKVLKPDDPTMAGYNFENWTYQGESWAFALYVITEDITLDANWSDPIEYTITYNTNGGTLPESNFSKYTVNSSFNFADPSKAGFNFSYWTDENDDPISKIEKGTTGNKIITAHWIAKSYKFVAVSDNESGGTVEGSGQYDCGSEVTAVAAANSGYKFTGWYYNGSLISSQTSYTFKMPSHNYALSAKFEEIIYYTITFETNGGTEIEPITALCGDPINVSTTKEDYTFAGWYTDSSLSSTYAFTLGNTMPAYSGVLYAKWDAAAYTITYHLDCNMTKNSKNPSTYYFTSSTITLLKPTVTCGTFEGWYTDPDFQNQITEITTGSRGNLDLYAKQTATMFTLSFDTNGGESIESASYKYKETIVLPTPEKDGYIFRGWYSDSDLITKNSYSTMPSSNKTLYAKWITTASVTGEHNAFDMGIRKYVYFGSYPQTIENNAEIIAKLDKTTINSNGYYEYNGIEYAKRNASICSSSYTYSNNEKATSGETCYFRVEPILWLVLTYNVAGYYVLLSESVLFNSLYDYNYYGSEASNVYKTSYLRSWLNGSFYAKAFSNSEQDMISPLTITGLGFCDNVGTLSASDYSNSTYGLTTSLMCCQPTDYAIANGCSYNTNLSYLRNTSYWTSSGTSSSNTMRIITSSGTLIAINGTGTAVTSSCGVRPAISINL